MTLRICGIVVALFWSISTACCWLAVNSGVIRETVHFKCEDATPITGTLYRPRGAGTRLPGVLLLHGTALARQSCIPGLAAPLARDGFLTLSIDMCGHGQSGGSLPRAELMNPEKMLDSVVPHPEVEAALAFLKSHPRFADGHTIAIRRGPRTYLRTIPRLAVVGHSRGGWAATNAGYQHADVDCTVAVGAAPSSCDLCRPRNFLVLTGSREELFPQQKCRDVLAIATGGSADATLAAVSHFWMGTARRLIKINNINHFTELADPAAARTVVQWVASSLDIDAGRITCSFLIGAIVSVLAATASGAIAAWWLLHELAGSHGSVTAPLGILSWIRPYLALIAALFCFTPLVAVAAPAIEIGPFFNLGPSILLVAVAGSLAWFCSSLATHHVAEPVARPDSTLPKGIGLGAAGFLLATIWLGIPWGCTWADLLPASHRMKISVLAFLLAIPWTLALSHGMGRILRTDSAISSAAVRGILWMTVAGCLWLSHVWFSVEANPLFIIPAGFLAASFIIPLPLWLMPSRPWMDIARGFCHALALAWLLGCHLPIVHG